MKTLYTVDTIMTDTPLLEHYKEKKYEKISGGRREGILALLGNFDGKTVLDVGCANFYSKTSKKIVCVTFM